MHLFFFFIKQQPSYDMRLSDWSSYVCFSYLHWLDQANQAIHYRHLIIAEEGSQATIIEEYRGDETVSYFSNTITEVVTAAKAKVTHYKIQRESKQAYHIGFLTVQQARDRKSTRLNSSN